MPESTPVDFHTITRTTSSVAPPLAGPSRMLTDLYRHRHLITQLTARDVLGRYRGSFLGIGWSFLSPLLLLGIFTFVFHFIFHAKFTGHPSEGPADFALMLFSALIIFNMFAECLARSPNMMLLNANYVSKVVFPLEILPVTAVLAAVVHLLISFVPLMLAVFCFRNNGIPFTAVFWPLLLVPIVFWALGITWLLSAIGAFARDLNDLMLAVTTILMYASAVFYPIDRVPPEFQFMVRYNPLAFFSEQSRDMIVWGKPMEWDQYGWVLFGGAVFMTVSYLLFMRVKHAFADVI